MTHGTNVVTGSFFPYTPNTFQGATFLGSKVTRSWSGGDTPKRERASWIPKFIREPYVVYRVIPERARWLYVDTKTERILRFERPQAWKNRLRFLQKEVTPAQVKQLTKYRLRYNPLGNRPRDSRRLPDHPYTLTATRIVNTTGTVYDGLTPKVYPSTWLQSLGLIGTGVQRDWSSNDDLAVLGKLRTSINGSEFNLGVFLAETTQARRMIAESATKIERCVHYLRRGSPDNAWRVLTGIDARALQGRAKNFYVGDISNPTRLTPPCVTEFLSTRDWRKAARAASNNWLEMVYGWLPLLHDIETGAQFIAHAASAPVKRVFRVRRSKLDTFLPVAPDIEIEDRKAWTSVQVKATLFASSQAMLSGLTDVASILWEKKPWTFVADWVIPISSYLNALGLAWGVSGEFVTTKSERMYVAGVQQNGIYAVTYRGTGSFYSSIYMNRSVSSTLDVPLPSVKPLAKVASWMHTANAVALLTQRLKASSASLPRG